MRVWIWASVLLLSSGLLSGCLQTAADEARAQAYWQWYRAQPDAVKDREDRREAIRLQALGMALSGGGPFRMMPPLMPPPPMRQPQPCVSTVNQGFISTLCP